MAAEGRRGNNRPVDLSLQQIVQAFDISVLGNPLWRWLVFGLVAVFGVFFVFAVRATVFARVRAWANGARSVWLDASVEALFRTRSVFLVVIVIELSTRVLSLPRPLSRFIEAAFTISVLGVAGAWLNTTLRVAMERYRAREQLSVERATLLNAVSFVGRIAVWSIVVLLTLSNLGVEVGALVAGLGIGGIAAALAVQNVLGDTIAAMSIYVDRPFDIGDFVIVGEELGTVTHVGWRSSRIKALGGQQVVMPNADLAGSRIHNYGRMEERRVVTQLGIVYSTPLERVAEAAALLRDAVEAVEGVRFDRAHFKGFGPSSLDYEMVWYVLSGDYNVYMDRQQEILLGALRRFRERGLDFAFPSRSIYVASSSEPPSPEALLPNEPSPATPGAGR